MNNAKENIITINYNKGACMEELYVYALLMSVGFEFEDEYQSRLDEIFMEDTSNELLVDLEWKSSNKKETVLYLLNHMENNDFNVEVFGKIFISKLKRIYDKMELRQFSENMYRVWGNLPTSIAEEKPFWILSYADDPLSWGDEKQTRELYEEFFTYYESDKKNEVKEDSHEENYMSLGMCYGMMAGSVAMCLLSFFGHFAWGGMCVGVGMCLGLLIGAGIKKK